MLNITFANKLITTHMGYFICKTTLFKVKHNIRMTDYVLINTKPRFY